MGVARILLLRNILGTKALLGPLFLREIWARAQGLEDQGRSKEIFRSNFNISGLAFGIPRNFAVGTEVCWAVVQIIPLGV